MQKNRVGSFYDIADAKAIATLPNVGVDENEMTATAVITTPTWDRQHDSVNPLGGMFDEYAKNPVVYFDHGLTITEPIACTDDKEGKLWLTPSDSGIVAKAHFSNRNKLSEQMFFLVADRILRGASLRFKPTEAPIRKSQGNRFEKWKMEEWSFTGLGVNPDCVADVLRKGRINNSSIDEGIMKSLRAYAPPPSPRGTQVRGNKLIATGSMMPKSLEKSMKLLGQQVMESAHTHLSDLNSKLKASLKLVENPKVKEVMDSVEKSIADTLVLIEGGYNESYRSSLKCCNAVKEKMFTDEGHMKSYSDEDRKRLEDDEDYLKSELESYEKANEVSDEEKMKSFLVTAPAERFKLSGLAVRLDEIATDESVPDHLRSSLKSMINGIGSIVQSALTTETQSQKPVENKPEDSVKKSLLAEIADLKKQIETAIPCSR